MTGWLPRALECPATAGAAALAAIRYGTYSREANTLVTVSRSGALTFKMTKRTATFKAPDAPTGPPAEQDIPLAVPKKTRLYVDQTQRERECAVDMHRIFQRDLCKLRLATARAYVKARPERVVAAASLSQLQWLAPFPRRSHVPADYR